MNTAEEIRKIQTKLGSIERRLTDIREGGGGDGPHNILSVTHSDSLTQAVVAGDMIYGNATPKWARLGIAGAGNFIRSNGALPVWGPIQAGDLPAHAGEHELGGGDQVDHDALLNFVANEHIDHTAVNLTAGTGLTGGGDISANRTFALSHLGFEALVDPNVDRIVFWDDGAGALAWLVPTEGIQIDGLNLLLDINGLGEDAGVTSGDFFVYYDTVDGIHYKIDFDDMPGGGGASPWTVNGIDIYWDGGGVATIGTTDHDSQMTEGLCLYQGASDDIILAFQSSDIAHGIISGSDTDTYGFFKKVAGTTGGLHIEGVGEQWDGVEIHGAVQFDLGPSWTQTHAPIVIVGKKKSGIGYAEIVATDILFAVHNLNYPDFIINGQGDVFVHRTLHIFDTALNAKMSQGITIQQSGYDNEIISLKSTDVNHGITTQTELDTYGFMKKVSGLSGGTQFTGLTEATRAMIISGIATNDNTTHGDGASAPVMLAGGKKDGTGQGAVGAEGNVVVMANYATEIWGIDAEGDVWQQGSLWILTIKSGATQVGAGASVNELWKTSGHATLPDNVVMIGV